ncbi:MAG: hypothetical protein LBE18_01585, partial [Planctomycetaceae bacterium]|nr:hypothetical protein [Planctomycetaceae bacterium]
VISEAEEKKEAEKQLEELRKESLEKLDELLKAKKTAVEKSLETSFPVIAEYQLQECEQVVRQMVSLDMPNSSNKINNEYKALQELAEKIIKKKNFDLWTKAKQEMAKFEEIDIKNERGKGTIQKKLEILNKKATILQNVIPTLTDDFTRNEALKKRDEFAETARSLSNEQSKKYNNWALDEIDLCLKECRSGVGWFANGDDGRQRIANSLVTHLAPIDNRFLTTEVSRAYNEVCNKYMAENQLNPVKDDKSINEQGNILNTLKRMYETNKKDISDF